MVKKTPVWIFFSMIPLIGSIAIIYAGSKINRFTWIFLGLFATTLNIILASTHLLGFVWLGQMAIAFALKDDFIYQVNRNRALREARQQPAKLLPKTTTKIDINNSSKDDLVYGLGLPIVYANEIESAQKEGYLFTHIEELADIAGIPNSYLPTLESLIIFSYDFKKEADFSWRKCNTLSEGELVAYNLDPDIAAKIVREREQRGFYKSFPDLRRRTGLPLQKITALL